jgi:hypothetical protein
MLLSFIKEAVSIIFFGITWPYGAVENVAYYPLASQATHRGTWIFFWIDRKRSILIVNFLDHIQEKWQVGRHGKANSVAIIMF